MVGAYGPVVAVPCERVAVLFGAGGAYKLEDGAEPDGAYGLTCGGGRAAAVGAYGSTAAGAYASLEGCSVTVPFTGAYGVAGVAYSVAALIGGILSPDDPAEPTDVSLSPRGRYPT